MTFEESMNKLEEIKQKLENPDISLDESMKLYEESVSCTKTCLELLKNSEGKINVIKAEIDGLVEKPLETEN